LAPLEFKNIEQRFELGNNAKVAIILDKNFNNVKRDLKTELMNNLIDISKKHGLIEHVNRAYYM
jgi:hypothetical protein